MLVLTRRTGEAIVIGGAIRVVVLGVEGERVRLGIVAPRDVAVLRAELADAVSAENAQAARAGTQSDLLRQLHERLPHAGHPLTNEGNR
jgi:carbon storage regulator